jgi:hypothetical protein
VFALAGVPGGLTAAKGSLRRSCPTYARAVQGRLSCFASSSSASCATSIPPSLVRRAGGERLTNIVMLARDGACVRQISAAIMGSSMHLRAEHNRGMEPRVHAGPKLGTIAAIFIRFGWAERAFLRPQPGQTSFTEQSCIECGDDCRSRCYASFVPKASHSTRRFLRHRGHSL